MKLLFVSSLYPPNVVGGAELSLCALTRTLAAAGDDVHVATLAPPGGPTVSTERDCGVTVHRFALANLYWPWSDTGERTLLQKSVWHTVDSANAVMARRLAALVARLEPDVVVTNNLQGWSTAVVTTMKRVGVPVVHVLHDYSLLCPQTTMYRGGSGCGTGDDRCGRCRLLTRPRHVHMREVDAVIGVSQSILDFHDMHGLFRGVQHTVIHNSLKDGIEIRRSPPPRIDGAVRFGYLGRLESMKGIETLLRAADYLARDDLLFEVLVAGTPSTPTYLDSLKSRWPLRNVHYLGFVNDPVRFLDSIDCLVFPTDWLEALGNGVFEAFARGIPVIGSDAGGIPETISHGTDGFIFQRGNWRDLADRMRLLAVDAELRESLGSAALAKAPGYLATLRAGEYRRFLRKVAAAKTEHVGVERQSCGR